MKNEFYRSMIEKSPVGYAYHRIICNEQGTPIDYEFIETNAAFEKLTGFKSSEIAGKRVTEVIPELKARESSWIEIYGDIALRGGSKEFEQYSETLKRWYKVSAYSPEKNYFVTWMSDVSEEKHDLEEKTILLTSLNDIIFELDEDCTFRNIIDFNDDYLFMPREEIIGKKADDIFPEDFAALIVKTLKKAEDTGVKQYIEYKSLIPDADIWFGAELFTICTVLNKKKYIISVKNITERIKIEEELKNKTAELERFFEINLDLLCIADIRGNFIKVNNAWENTLGYPVGELEKRKFLDFIHPEDMEATLEAMSKLSHNESVLYFTNRYRCSDNTYRYIEWCSLPYGELIYAAARDITERMKMQEQLLINEERFNIALNGTRAGLWDWDIKSNTVYYSEQWKSMLGYAKDEVPNSFDGWKNLWHPDDKERIERAMSDYISGKTDIYEIDHRLRKKDGRWRWILTRGEAIRDTKGDLVRWVGTNIDITYIKEAEEKILYLSFHDQLTGLYNRRFYEEELKRVNVERNLPLSLVMADVNGLKLANDAFGHLVGDALLKKTADCIKNQCRADEIVARIGGDEFIIVLPKTDIHEAECLVERIVKSIGNEKIGILDLSVSFGWATKSFLNEDIDDILKKAEEVMYRIKLNESPKTKEKEIKKMLTAMCEKFPQEREHSEWVSRICEYMARVLGLGNEEIENIKIAGLYHDIGKINISKSIIYKPEKLSDTEWIEVMRHSATGYHILNSVNKLSQAAKYVLHHHERWDGAGYPDGLAGADIPLQSRIICIADAFHAMTSERAYRKVFRTEEAAEEIRENAGTQFDPNLAKVFIDNIDKFA